MYHHVLEMLVLGIMGNHSLDQPGFFLLASLISEMFLQELQNYGKESGWFWHNMLTGAKGTFPCPAGYMGAELSHKKLGCL